MTPWRRAAVALVLALMAVLWTVAGMLPLAPPDAGGLVLLFTTTWGAGLVCAGWTGRPGPAGLLLAVGAAAAALALGAALFGLMLAPPAGAAIVALATLRMAALRPLLLLILVGGALAARAVARR